MKNIVTLSLSTMEELYTLHGGETEYTYMHTCNSSNSVLNSSESDKIDSGRQGPKIYIDRRESEERNSSVRRETFGFTDEGICTYLE